MPGRIIIVDDDTGFSRAIARRLGASGHDVSTCATATEAREMVRSLRPDVIVLDHHLPDGDGLELLVDLKATVPAAELLMATAYPNVEVAVEAMRRGAADYIDKGSDSRECLIRIERATEVSSLRHRMMEASRPVNAVADDSGIIGDSSPMRALRSRLEALSGSDDTTALILGETGTGKSLIAQAIHAGSGRAYEPFVAVDCTTIPTTLVESELFGHHKGAFTHATGHKQGRVEAAGRGTLFLDEIGELELGVQAKLLRLLEEREFTRVGDTRTRSLHARIITATNRDLSRAVQQQRFRADLLYRLQVFVVPVPPLRERGDDILTLASHFAAERARAVGKPVPSFHPEALAALARYSFPGNVRELKNMIEQAVLLSESGELLLEDFPVLMRPERPRSQAPSARPEAMPFPRSEDTSPMLRVPDLSSPQATREREPRPGGLAQIRAQAAAAEREKLVEALERCHGNISAAARELQLSRHQLMRRMKKHGLS